MNSMNEQGFLQEIEEDLARQRLEALWKKYGKFIITIALTIVLGTAAGTGWKTYTHDKQLRITSELLGIVEDMKLGKTEKIASLEKYAKENAGDAKTALAKLTAASLALEANDMPKALALYNEIAADTKADPFFRQLGDLLAVQTQLDEGDIAALEKRLTPLMDKDAAWRFTAREYAGYLAIRAGDKEKAKKIFTELKNLPDVPNEVARRAMELVQWLDMGA